MRDYQYTLFDLDGTLTDPKEGITKSVAYALKYFGIEVENLDTLCKFIGPPLKDSFMKYYGLSEDDAHLAVEKYREHFEPCGIFQNKVYDGVEELLKELRTCGKQIILATSKPTVYAQKILEHFHLDTYFSYVAGSELDGRRVKKGDVIAYALEQAGVKNKSAAVMIGDREHDIIGSKEHGLFCIGVLYGYGSREEFERYNADCIVRTVEELRQQLL